jgi:hypothetical protein
MNLDTVLVKYKNKIDFMVKHGCHKDIIINHYLLEKPILSKKWLFVFFKEWIDSLIDDGEISLEEGVAIINEYTSINS